MSNSPNNEQYSSTNVINVSEVHDNEQVLNHYPNKLLHSHNSLDLREFWKTILRKKKSIFAIASLIILATFLITISMDSIYRASATLQIDRKTLDISGRDVDLETFNDFRDKRDFYETQFELLKSKKLIKLVIDDLKLQGKLEPMGLKTQLKNAIKKLIGMEEKKSTYQYKTFSDNLTVEPVKTSQLVIVSYDSHDPKLSSHIVNSLIQHFRKDNLNRRTDSASNATGFLEGEINKSKEKISTLEKKLNLIKNEQEIFSYKSGEEEGTTLDDDLKLMNNLLGDAKEETIDARSSYDVDQAEENKQTLDKAKRKEVLLREEVGKLKDQIFQAKEKTLEYSAVKQEIETNREHYEGLVKRLNDIKVSNNTSLNNITIIDAAEPPTKKYKPSLSTNLALGALLGLLVGLAVAFLREFMDDSIRDINELEKITNLPVLGIIPNVKGKSPANIATSTYRNPTCSLSESFRSLRTSLRFSMDSNTPKIIFITSPCASEGKSTSAVNLASAYAQTGQSVLLIDADLRNPTIHKFLGQKNEQGLSKLLAQPKNLFDRSYVFDSNLIKPTYIPHLSILTSGQLPKEPVELLSNTNMHDLLTYVSYEYDQVIIDGPPILGLADSLVLSHFASATILSIHAGKTRHGAVVNALKRLKQSHGNVIGTLLTRILPALGSDYGYDYVNYYYSENNKRSARKKYKTTY